MSRGLWQGPYTCEASGRREPRSNVKYTKRAWSIFPPKLIWLQHPFLQRTIIFRESSKILIEVMMDGPIKHF